MSDASTPTPNPTSVPPTSSFWVAFKLRLKPFLDPTVWILLVVSLIPLWVIDPVMAKTLGEWTIFSVALGGVATLISMLIFPHIDFSDHAGKATTGQTSSGLVILGICTWMGFLILALVLWSKA